MSVRKKLFNAFKHAHAERATLTLRLDRDDQLSFTVSDDAFSFAAPALDSRSETGSVGWGLFSIRDRLTLLGGRVDIDSAPGRGTRVHLFAPRRAAQGHTPSAGDRGRAPRQMPAARDGRRPSPGAL